MILEKFKLDGKVALVTGASSGLGQAIALALAEAGADVACHARSKDKADETRAEIINRGRRAAVVTGDVADSSVPVRVVEDTIAEFGRVDILVNNAGTIRRSPVATAVSARRQPCCRCRSRERSRSPSGCQDADAGRQSALSGRNSDRSAVESVPRIRRAPART